jgi:regulatory protein
MDTKAYNQAIKLLSFKMRTVGELNEKLAKKFSKAVVLEVVRKLEELDFVNDERYAQIFVENLKQYKDFGYYGIKQKLHAKHIPTDVIEKVLQDFFTGDEELDVARRFLKKLKRQGRKEYAQLARSLTSKGYHTDVIREILREEFKERR